MHHVPCRLRDDQRISEMCDGMLGNPLASQEGWGPQPEKNVVLGRLARARRAAFLDGFAIFFLKPFVSKSFKV